MKKLRNNTYRYCTIQHVCAEFWACPNTWYVKASWSKCPGDETRVDPPVPYTVHRNGAAVMPPSSRHPPHILSLLICKHLSALFTRFEFQVSSIASASQQYPVGVRLAKRLPAVDSTDESCVKQSAIRNDIRYLTGTLCPFLQEPLYPFHSVKQTKHLVREFQMLSMKDLLKLCCQILFQQSEKVVF